MKSLYQQTRPVRQLLMVILVTTFLFGCAAERIHREGQQLINQGQLEEGLEKLQQAISKDPDNLAYRGELIQQREQIVYRLLVAAQSERQAGRHAEAATYYQRVLKIEKDNARAKAGLAALAMDERHFTVLKQAMDFYEKHDVESAQSVVRTILLENPQHTEAKQLQRKIDEQIAKDALAGPTLRPEFKKPVTLQFRDANLKMVAEAISRSNGVNILLDKDIKGDLRTTIFVKNAPLEEALDLILMQNTLEKKILSDNTIFIYPDTPAKVKEFQELKIRTFQLTNADVKQIQTMLKTLLKSRDVFIDEKNNSLVMRDTPDAIRLAEKLIAAQDLPEPEVMLEVEVLEITRAHLTQLGVRLPQQIDISAPGTPATTTVNTLPGGGVVTTTTPASPLTLRTLRNLNGSYFNVSPLNGGVDLRNESGTANILASPRIRVRNKEKAKIMIGDRVPVITSAQTPVAGGSAVSTTNVQYLDVGLKLDVEPNIHLDDDVAIKVNLEVSNIVREITTGQTVAYQIGARSANTILRLKDGETQVLAGLISDEERQSAQKFPGLGDLPVLGRLFSSEKDDAKKTEIVLSITPHLTRASQRPDAQQLEFWSGTDNNLRNRPIAVKSNNKPVVVGKPATPAETNNVAVTNEQGAIAAGSGAAGVPLTGSPLSLNLQAPTQAIVGKQFEVTVNADATQAVGTLSFALDYDPEVLTMVKITEGELFKQGGNKTIFTNKLDQKKGRMFAQISRVGKTGITGKGNVATFVFNVTRAKTQVPLQISNPLPLTSDGVSLPFNLPAPSVITLSEDKPQ